MASGRPEQAFESGVWNICNAIPLLPVDLQNSLNECSNDLVVWLACVSRIM
jgi:hypothetical protein